MSRRSVLWLMLSTAIAGFASVAPVLATSSGIASTGFNSMGCNLCHFSGTVPTVSLTGPTVVMPSTTNIYTLTINNPGGQNSGGLNVSAPTGVLATGGPESALTQTVTGAGGRAEITHTMRKAAVAGMTTFSFQWTAPSGSSVVTMAGWGNAVNGNSTPSGDAAALASLMIAVGDTPTPTMTATATPTPTPTVPVNDAVVLPPKPLKVKIAVGALPFTKNVKVAVRNGNTTDAAPIKLAVTGCAGVAGMPDFDKDTLGAQDTIVLEAGKSKKAVVPLSISSAAFASFNAKSPARCQLTFTVTAEIPGNTEPSPSNNVASMELNVLDLNDPDSVAAPNHESVTTSLKPLKVKIGEGALGVTKFIKLKVMNADDEVDPGHQVTVAFGAGTCIGVGLPDFDKDTPASIENSTTIAGQKTASGVVTLMLDASDYQTANAKSPARCTQQLCVTGPMGNVEPNTTNDCTELVVDVFDANDF